MRWAFSSSDAEDAVVAKHSFLDYLKCACIVTADDLYSASVVYGELVANVVQHAPGSIEITAGAGTAGRLTLQVVDEGHGFALNPQLPAGELSENGRGLFLASQSCRSLSNGAAGKGRAEVTATFSFKVAASSTMPPQFETSRCNGLAIQNEAKAWASRARKHRKTARTLGEA